MLYEIKCDIYKDYILPTKLWIANNLQGLSLHYANHIPQKANILFWPDIWFIGLVTVPM